MPGGRSPTSTIRRPLPGRSGRRCDAPARGGCELSQALFAFALAVAAAALPLTVALGSGTAALLALAAALLLLLLTLAATLASTALLSLATLGALVLPFHGNVLIRSPEDGHP